MQIAYTVRKESLEQFLAAMKPVGDSRRRRGGSRWGLLRSGEDHDVMLESFIVPSWGEFRRQETQRLTGRDREILAAALEFCEGTPAERHYLPTT